MTETAVSLPSNAPASVVALARKMKLEAETFGDDGMAATMDILDNILSATDEAGIFEAADAGTTSGQDFLGVGFRLREDGISARKSTKSNANGFPYYYQLAVTRIDTGKPTTVSCGGLSAVAVLTRFRDIGVLAKYEDDGGMPLVFTEKVAGNGNVLLLQPYVASNGSSKK